MPVFLYFVLTAVIYFYYNWRYFSLVTAVLEMPELCKKFTVSVSLINFTLFYICSVAEFNLVLNWALFFVFLYAETYFYCRRSWQQVFYFTMIGILCGLAFNILFRCAAAIVIDQPLTAFDNHVSSGNNYKAVPVILGFLGGGVLMHLLAGSFYRARIRKLISHASQLPFLLQLSSVMFLYLFLNLLLYQSKENSLLLKLWGVKSCFFVLAGTYLGMRYSLKICELSDYREQNREMQRKLSQKDAEEKDLRNLAYRDALTGAYNRQYAIKTVGRLIGETGPFTLCYIDLDDLKGVNDRHGHTAGDRYLQAAAQALKECCRRKGDLLFRFGGDEFLIIFPGLSVPAAEECLEQASRRLAEQGEGEMLPFPMSLSFGAVESAAAESIRELVETADKKMYLQKKKKRGL